MAGLIALVGGLYIIKVLFDKTQSKEVLKGNVDVINKVDGLEDLKKDLDAKLNDEESKRQALDKQNQDNTKQENISNDQLADFFNNRK